MIITVDHVSKWYGQVIGLNDVTLQVSLVVVLGLIALSFSVLERRVRGVEVVT